MEKIVLKSIELEIAVDRLKTMVITLQSAINSGCSVGEVISHYASVKAASARVQQLVGEVRSGSFQIATKYNFEWVQ